MTYAQLLMNPDVTGTALLVGLLDEFGVEALDWDPQTINMEIEAEWHVKPPQVNRDKVQALITYLTTNLFFQNLEAFGHICNALSGEEADFEHYELPDVTQMCWAIAECTLLNPPDPKDPADQWSSEIQEYVRQRLDLEGFTRVPRMLSGVVELEDQSKDIEDTFGSEGINVKSYFDSQQRKIIEVDAYVAEKLLQLTEELAGLQLQHGDRDAIEELRTNARKAAGHLSSEISKAQESSSPSPAL